jgi:hypothetical protein
VTGGGPGRSGRSRGSTPTSPTASR